jgi:hypothetical protein
MSKVISRYFVADGTKAEAVAAEGLRRSNEVRLAGLALAKTYGAAGTVGRGNAAPYALAWEDGHLQEPRSGFLAPEFHCEDGEKYLVCRPDKRTALGKKIAAAMRELPVFSFSDYACREFGVMCSTIGASAVSPSGMAMFHSVAGFMKGTLIFSIPFGGDAGNGKPPAVSIPLEFREITAGEYMDLIQPAGTEPGARC